MHDSEGSLPFAGPAHLDDVRCAWPDVNEHVRDDTLGTGMESHGVLLLPVPTWVIVEHLVDRLPADERSEGEVLPGSRELLGGTLLYRHDDHHVMFSLGRLMRSTATPSEQMLVPG